jgi:hypothetical protein
LFALAYVYAQAWAQAKQTGEFHAVPRYDVPGDAPSPQK